MKKYLSILLLLICFTFSAFTQSNNSYPEPRGYVNDFENILTEKQEKELDSLIIQFEQQTQIEIAIVTLDSTMTSKENFFNYTLELGNYWGVGKKDLNNGILIGISSTLRVIRIQNGYGIEKIITDEETKQIIDNYFIPSFKNGQYFEGVKLGTIELMKFLN